ncbi:cation transporter [Rhodomicrobium udaipurense JA643]|uniref:Efflux RND transporter periplasmic adaptor subunit n=1 Tax=Rhodomicrobium udaipurense TaxID=1202716 RepID=A0A8I1KI18_9HYPH|nr:efflux RND transporter periplasmic adaptor subunit [Rhodomicrobium udaipurense]KAI95396.1 cation transporter [Rhodomicrobium udaipurense JA643]MBJ7542142.1 efflux RND transporter periplasmic adaptor subunit [Rhodomicrobium udaipurense]
MNSKLLAGTAVMAVFASAVVGYRSEPGTWPSVRVVATSMAAEPGAVGREVLYWRDPDGKNDFSPAPKKTPDGRAYLPVYEDQEASFQGAKPAKPQGGRKILYYRNPMGLPDVSSAPKKDSMGMDYIPVYEGDEEDGSTVKISPGKLQRTGVRSEPVTRRALVTSIRAPGVVQADEHRQSVVALRFDAFLNGLEHITTGSKVRKGEPLMRVYSSVLSASAAQYVTDLGIRDTGGLSANRGARQRLENLGVPDAIIKDIERSKQGSLTVVWPAPRDGFVVEHNVVEGMQAKTGDVLFRIADLSVIWVLADVAERDLAMIAPGQKATVTPRGYPGKTFTGTISLIYPVLNKETRTARVRIELANPETILRPNMYADVVIDSGSNKPVVAVPESAIIDSGIRKTVIVDKGEGRFEPREVKTGNRGDGFVEIREGVSDKDKVVTAANFLIDAESNLKAALQGLTTGGEAK